MPEYIVPRDQVYLREHDGSVGGPFGAWPFPGARVWWVPNRDLPHIKIPSAYVCHAPNACYRLRPEEPDGLAAAIAAGVGESEFCRRAVHAALDREEAPDV